MARRPRFWIDGRGDRGGRRALKARKARRAGQDPASQRAHERKLWGVAAFISAVLALLAGRDG